MGSLEPGVVVADGMALGLSFSSGDDDAPALEEGSAGLAVGVVSGTALADEVGSAVEDVGAEVGEGSSEGEASGLGGEASAVPAEAEDEGAPPAAGPAEVAGVLAQALSASTAASEVMMSEVPLCMTTSVPRSVEGAHIQARLIRENAQSLCAWRLAWST